jgi:hypothetical protein
MKRAGVANGFAFARLVRVLARLVLALCAFGSFAAQAQLIDRIDVVPAANGQAEIIVRFTVNVLFQRSTAPGPGRELRVFLRAGGIDGALQQRDREVRRSDQSPLVPRFTVSYPESDSSLMLLFDAATPFSARQGPDARSVSILVPVRPSAGPVEGQAALKPPASALPAEPQGTVRPKEVEPRIPRNVEEERARNAAAGTPGAAQPPGGAERSTLGPVPLAQVESVAAQQLSNARAALDRNDPAAAIVFLNNLLDLPSNASSAAAQELAGLARERSGDIAKARGEYELYLRLYPQGEAAARVRARVAALEGVQAVAATSAIAAAQAGLTQSTPWQISGGISQNYYTGKSHIEILTPPPPGFLAFTQQNLTTTDQHALITNLDLNARKRSETGVDHRFVFRDTYSANFLPNQKDTERLSTAYYEIGDRAAGYQGRVGRQSGSFAVLGQFDGIYAGYQVRPDIRINAAAGVPVEYTASTSPIFQLIRTIKSGSELAPVTPLPYNRDFWAASIEYQAKPEQVGGNVYFVQQRAEGYVDRQAIGMEARYFDARRSGFMLLDYDVAIRGLNIATFQGNMQFGTATNVYFLADHRKSPFLQLTNALSAATSPTTSLPATNVTEALLNTGLSLSELRNWARDLAAESNLVSAGVTHPLSQRWQIGGDVNMSRLSSSRGAGAVPAQAGTEPTRSYSGQLIGNSVLFQNDSAVANLNIVHAPTLRAKNLSLNHVSTWLSKLRIDLALRYYTQVDSLNTTLKRISPTMRVNYRWLNNLSFEAEAGMEKSQQKDASGGTTDSDRQYFYLGYRWDFQ